MEEVKYILGDLVNPDGSIAKITSIAPGLGKGNIEIGFSNGWHFTAGYRDFNDEALGIPLTTEILEKNGWKEGGYGFYIKDNFPFLIYKDADAFNVKIDKFDEDAFLKLSYCHQLQHLLFGLGLDSSLKV